MIDAAFGPNTGPPQSSTKAPSKERTGADRGDDFARSLEQHSRAVRQQEQPDPGRLDGEIDAVPAPDLLALPPLAGLNIISTVAFQDEAPEASEAPLPTNPEGAVADDPALTLPIGDGIKTLSTSAPPPNVESQASKMTAALATTADSDGPPLQPLEVRMDARAEANPLQSSDVPRVSAARKPEAVAPTQMLLPPTEAEPKGSLSPRHARIVVGEGGDRIAVNVRVAHEMVHVITRAASSDQAEALARSSHELEFALHRHGLSLGDFRHNSDERESHPRSADSEESRTDTQAEATRESAPNASVVAVA